MGTVGVWLVALGVAAVVASCARAEEEVTGTFSIVAVDPETGVCGAAVASKYPAVGRIVPYVRAGVGAGVGRSARGVEVGRGVGVGRVTTSRLLSLIGVGSGSSRPASPPSSRSE